LNSEDDLTFGLTQADDSDRSSESREDFNEQLHELEGRSDRLGGPNGIADDALSEISSSAASTDLENQNRPTVEPYDFDSLPAHKCAYCGVHDVQAVVKCQHHDCQKWFCNGKGLNEYGSHIVLHLVKSKHKEIALHPQSELKDSKLECHSCQCTNIFLLGFMPAKTEAYIILLCREPCLRQISAKENAYDTENWKPLIENKALISWLVRSPTELEHRKSRQIKP